MDFVRFDELTTNHPISAGCELMNVHLQAACTASAYINRKKKATTIDEDNLALFRRLQAVRPSPQTRQAVLEKDFKLSQKYAKNCSHFKAQPQKK